MSLTRVKSHSARFVAQLGLRTFCEGYPPPFARGEAAELPPYLYDDAETLTTSVTRGRVVSSADEEEGEQILAR